MQDIKIPRDFRPKQLTETEKEILRMQRHFESIVQNIAQQVRAVCITLKIDPDMFIKNFHDAVAQEDYLNKHKEAENKLIKEFEEKNKTLDNLKKH